MEPSPVQIPSSCGVSMEIVEITISYNVIVALKIPNDLTHAGKDQ